jgi:HSP20 family protein
MNLIPWRSKQREGVVAESPLAALRNEMDRIFDSYIREPFGSIEWPGFLGGERGWPAVDVSESEKEITIRAELPGVDPNELDVSVTNNQVVIGGEKKETQETKEKGYYHSEARYGSFRRVIPLPEGADSEKVDAQYAHGVLTLKIAKIPAVAAKRIEIKT